MPEIHAHITGPVVQEVFGDETSAAVLAAETLIPVLTTVDFSQSGGSVRINGTVYEYTGMDDGDESGIPSITLATGLVAGVDANTAVELWNASAGTVISEWKAPVTSDQDGTANTAKVSHVLVPLMSSAMPLGEGDSVLISVDSAGGWTIVDKLGATPAFDPGYITTGTLAATTTVIAGDPNGKRVQMDGTGTPAFEAYNAANVQTVNIDGEVNYIEGTLATGASGARVEVGSGVPGLSPVEEVRFYTGASEEDDPGILRAETASGGGVLSLWSPTTTAAPGNPAKVVLLAQTDTLPSRAIVQADSITIEGTTTLDGDVTVTTGALAATMGTGSVGTGTFRDSVDARVTALAPAKRKTINSQTGTTYTLVLTDEDKVIQVSNAATHTLTVPPNSSVAFTTGAVIEVGRFGGGAVTIAPGAGVTLDSRAGLTSINGLYGQVTLRYRGSDRWHLTGDLA